MINQGKIKPSGKAMVGFDFLVILLLINPLVIYLVSGNVILSIAIWITATGIFTYLRSNQNLRLISVLFFNLLLVMSLFIHAEAVFTFRFSDYIIRDLYVIKDKYYFNRPYLNETFRDKEFVVQYKTNRQGFRIGADDEPEITVENADWLFIGDSYTQGAQVQYEDLYTSKLFDYFPDKVIVNAGISGLGIADEYNYYINEGYKFNAKKVFLQICNFNDFMNVKERTSGFSDYLMHYSNFARWVLYGFKYANPAELPLGRWTEPFYPDEASNENYNVFYTIQSEKKKTDFKNFSKFLRLMNDAVTEHGAELIIIQIPTKEQVHYRYFDEVVRGFKIDVSKLDMKLPNAFVRKQCEKYRIGHLDLLGEFTSWEGNLFYEFDEHLNQEGHRVVAKCLSDYISNTVGGECQAKLLSGLNIGDRYPTFAGPEKNVLVYQSHRDGNMELFLADTLLNNPRRLTWNNVDEVHPYISVDASAVIFTEGDQEKNQTNVAMLNLLNGERKYFTDGDSTFGAIPVFNCNTTRIAFAEWKRRATRDEFSNPVIVVQDLITGAKETVTSDEYESWRPIFSPNGDKLYFISKTIENKFDIFEYTFATQNKRNITNSIFEEWDVAISHDGQFLIYSGNPNANWDLFRMDLASGKMEQLTNSIGNEWDPTISPGDEYIYYSGTFGLRNGIFRMKL